MVIHIQLLALLWDFEIAGKDRISYQKVKLWHCWGNNFMKYQDEYLLIRI